ncbi:hypothetical protein WG66_004005 [Moniliophthora roreri]|nr:hypothetical protein WG66_004005 [Moniliophthora roreri]
MEFLRGSSNNTFSGGQFNNIQGSQHTTNIYQSVRQEKEFTIWDDYRRVRTGDTYVTGVIGESTVKREGKKDRRRVIARRTISLARLEGKDKEFLHVAYDGPDAFKAFEMDFERFSSVNINRNPIFAQLFGYNDNRHGLPALIFHDELVPLAAASPVLLPYFSYLFDAMQTANVRLDVSELWVDPRTGTLRRGPYIQTPYSEWLLLNLGPIPILEDRFSPLSIQTYKDSSAVFNYLIRTLPMHAILRGIRLSSTGVWEWLNHDDAISMPRSFIGTVYNWRRRRIIAKYVGTRERWHYGLYHVEGMPDAMRETRTVMEDGSTRFMVTPEDVQDVRAMTLHYVLNGTDDFCDSWLAQAHSVFSQLGIHEDDWGELILQRKEYISPQGVIDTAAVMNPVYLFIRRAPHPSDNETIWKFWVEGEGCYWSSDPLGQQNVSEVIRTSLELPSFFHSLGIVRRYWGPSHYETAEKVHRHCGFDPKTTDLTRSLGLPVLEVVGDDNRFQILEEWEDSYSPTSSSESCDEFEAHGNCTSSDGSKSDDEEIILYQPDVDNDYTFSEDSGSDQVVYPRSAAVRWTTA